MPRKKVVAPPTEAEILDATKDELIKIIETHGLSIPVTGRVAVMRDAVFENWYHDDEEDEEEVEEEETEDDEDEDEEEDEEEETEDDEEDEAPPVKATKAKARTSGRKKAADPEDDPDWNAILDNLNVGSGDTAFLKEGRTQVKLRLEDPKNKRSFYAESTRVYRGDRRVRYLLRGLLPKLDPPAVKAIPVGKTVLKAVLNLLAEGYDLLSDDGHGITIVRSGKGLETSYTVMPSPRPVPLPEEFDDLETDLETISENLEESDEARDDRREEDEETPVRVGRGGRPRRKATKDADEADW